MLSGNYLTIKQVKVSFTEDLLNCDIFVQQI